jgi:hypothetical protein
MARKRAKGRKRAKAPQRTAPTAGGPPWRYVPDENPKRKHHWDQPHAGFQEVGGVLVGKCPNNISTEAAEQLLNAGIRWSPKGWKKGYPKRIYNIRDKIVYRATPTIPGQSYHAFPERCGQDVPPDLTPQLRALAEGLGCLEDVERWLRT